MSVLCFSSFSLDNVYQTLALLTLFFFLSLSISLSLSLVISNFKPLNESNLLKKTQKVEENVSPFFVQKKLLKLLLNTS